MKLFLITLSCLAALVAAEEPILRNYHENVGIRQAELIRQSELAADFDGARIVGGSLASLGHHPYLGGLIVGLTTGATSVCGSSLLTNNRAVTAAHCWWDGTNQARAFVVVLGSIRLFSGGTRITTSDVELHGSFDWWTLNNDIAIIRFPHVSYSNNINRIALASGSSNYVGQWGQAAGFGRTSDWSGIDNSQRLSHIWLQVITNAVCQQTYGNIIISSTLCTSGAGGVGTCGGDSGGPFVIDGILMQQVLLSLTVATPTMKLSLVALSCLAALVAAEEPILTHYHENVGIRQAELIRQSELAADFDGSRIVGGSLASLGQYPYLAGLLISLASGATSVCGASLLSRTRLVGASHCWWDGSNQARSFVVVLGSTRLFSGGTRITTSDVEMHGSYNTNTLNNDVLIIRINSVNLSNNIGTINLATGSNSYAGTWAQAAGFGRTSDTAGISNNQQLSHVTLQVITNAVCRRTFGNVIVDSTLCTSGAGGMSTCGGDSGGPLAASNVLIGITSFGARAGCQRGLPAAFARVTSFASWIRARI